MTAENLCYAALYIVEAVIAWMYCSHLFSQKQSTFLLIALYTIGHLILFVVSQVFNSVSANMLSFFIINFALIFVCFSCSVLGAILHSAVLCFLMTITEIIVAAVLSLVTKDFGAYTYNLSALIALSAISKLFYFLTAIGIAHIFKPQKTSEKDPVMILLLCTLPITSAIIGAAIIYIGLTATFPPMTEWLMIASIIALLVVDLLVPVIYNNIKSITRENASLQLALQKDETETRMYQILQSQYESQRVLIHDIRHHHNLLDNMLQQNRIIEASTYLHELNELPAIQRRVIFCANPILNTILQQYSEQCTSNDVQLNCNVASSCVEHLDSVSLTAVFSNLLSNAYRAASSSEQKYIDLTVASAPTGDAVIDVGNSCDVPPVVGKNGLFRTDKADSQRHGIGLASISRVVKAYSGTMDMRYNADEKVVYTTISFPKS